MARGGLRTSIKLTGDWDRLSRVLNHGNFSRKLEHEITRIFVQMCEEIAADPQLADLVGNALLTREIKGGNTPLHDTKNLSKSFKVKKVGKMAVSISTEAPFAKFLHEGGTIDVTEKMRSMFEALSRVSNGDTDASTLTGRARELYNRFQHWYPLAESTKKIKIPARPFLKLALERSIKGNRQRIRNAAQRALK